MTVMPLSNISKFGRGGLMASILAGSLLFGNIAEAKNYVPVGKAADVLTQHRQLKYLTNYVAGLYTKDLVQKDSARKILYRTAIHESQNLEHRRQVVKRSGKLVEAGPARSIFGVEPSTAKSLVDWASDKPRARRLLTKTSGLTSEQLLSKSKSELADMLMNNEKFAAAMARTKFLSVSGSIPGTLADQAGYTAKKYFVGKRENRAALQAKYKKQYISDNIRFSKSVGAAMIKQQKTLSKGGTATSKAVKMIKKILPR